jgi:CheY-like chemotaxis protein
MPVMGGIESTREIRRFEAEGSSGGRKKSLIVALTGLAAVSDQREAFSAGVDSFMVKPVSFKALQQTLDEGLLRE